MNLENKIEFLRLMEGEKFKDNMVNWAKQHRRIWKREHNKVDGSSEYLASLKNYICEKIDQDYRIIKKEARKIYYGRHE